jgi:cellulose biosynthesis protein BcsQ
MTAPAKKEGLGIIYTFYSFKGGVGRTMALANVAALLAKWGHSVLVVDWDLEAPGLERFLEGQRADIRRVRATTPGIVDLVQARTNGASLPWRSCLIDVKVGGNGGRLSLLSAGRSGEDYPARLQSLDFPELFDKHGLGAYIEELRNEWIEEFDFVLIDSRTGVTDIGGICTVHLADVLVLLFTANDSSSEGALEIVERARKAQQHLPLDRRRLLAVPVPARDESRTEYERASEWKNKFAEQFGELYRDWLPSGKTPHDAIDLLRIPYVPYWSFGEQLPAIQEGTTDLASLGHAYEILARMLAARLDWDAALKGQLLGPPPSPRLELDEAWVDRHHFKALQGLSAAGMGGFMDVCHFSPDSLISKSQPELLLAARQAQVRGQGWSIGVALDTPKQSRPKPTNEGILANVSLGVDYFPGGAGHIFHYWTLTKTGNFYALNSLSEDEREIDRSSKRILFDIRIHRAAEAILHCANLYRALGVGPGAHVEMTVRYGGLLGRRLAASSVSWADVVGGENLIDDVVILPPMTFRLGDIESGIVNLVKDLCEPLFVIFDYASVPDEIYRQIVADFIEGKVS